ncbi:hypothetical protein [Synechococcus sp. GFB01]|uniref:hypothetical protein n=1 Tax=Synechococcus sp. GFB01 TaxID=1662190 RepID=UPI00064FE010|nr:hypothetical protein [Synechococcus sp. GFB01]KMM16895.1 hypothetical protein SYNGFB01_07810 [Synechococcus sp. GFB01]
MINGSHGIPGASWPAQPEPILSTQGQSHAAAGMEPVFDPVEAYFECITSCSLDDGECVTTCTTILREHS